MYNMIQPYTETIHDYNLRQQISGDNFRLPFCNTVSYSKRFIPCTLRLWNGLPASTKTSPSLNIFKTRLNSDVIDHGFEPRLDHTKEHSVIDHGFEPPLDHTKKHSVIYHGFEPRLG